MGKAQKKPAKVQQGKAKSDAGPVRGHQAQQVRNLSEQYVRAGCSKLLPEHRWMLAACAANPAIQFSEIEEVSKRLARQAEQGLPLLNANVMSVGETPRERRVVMGGVPADLARVPADVLYSRLCDLESLSLEVEDQKERVFQELLQRDFFEQVPNPEDADSGLVFLRARGGEASMSV